MAKEIVYLQCSHCKNAGVSVKFNGKYYCSRCFEELYDKEENDIKTLPAIVPVVKSRSKRASKNNWRTRASKKDWIMDLDPEAIEI